MGALKGRAARLPPQLTDDGALAAAQAVAKKPRLAALELNENQISAKGISKLKARPLLRRNWAPCVADIFAGYRTSVAACFLRAWCLPLCVCEC